MKNKFSKTGWLILVLWAVSLPALGQNNYFRIINNIPHLPVVVQTGDVVSPTEGAMVYSQAASGIKIYINGFWVDVCDIVATTGHNPYFKIINGISYLPVLGEPLASPRSGSVYFSSGTATFQVYDGDLWQDFRDLSATLTANNDILISDSASINFPVLAADPANVEAGAVYINSSDASFHVYDGNNWIVSACSCAPYVPHVFVEGPEGDIVSAHYVYADADGDLEGTSTFRWFKADDALGTNEVEISGAVGSVLDLNASGGYGGYVRVGVTPVALSGNSTGVETISEWMLIEESCAPYVPHVFVEGFAGDGLAAAHYVYADADGDLEGTSTFRWFKADDALGTNEVEISGAVGSTLDLNASGSYGGYVRVGVTPVALSGNFTGAEVFSEFVLMESCAPYVPHVLVEELANGTAVAHYVYADADGDAEDNTTFQWYIAANTNGDSRVALTGEINRILNVSGFISGQVIGCGVVPVAQTGNQTGSETIGWLELP